jgi:hypothetical protein
LSNVLTFKPKEDLHRKEHIKALEDIIEDLKRGKESSVESFVVFAMHSHHNVPPDSCSAQDGETHSYTYIASECSDPRFIHFMESMHLRNKLHSMQNYYGLDDPEED